MRKMTTISVTLQVLAARHNHPSVCSMHSLATTAATGTVVAALVKMIGWIGGVGVLGGGGRGTINSMNTYCTSPKNKLIKISFLQMHAQNWLKPLIRTPTNIFKYQNSNNPTLSVPSS